MAERRAPVTTPDMTNLLDRTKRDLKNTLNCVKIGTIQSFDTATQLASVKISIKQVVSIDENEVRTVKDYPVLLEVPVITLFGGVDFLSMPIQSGDNCLLFFNDRQIDNWLVSGDGLAPSVSRAHDISDAIAIVGVRPLTNSIANYLANGIRLSHGGGSAQMDLTDDLITTIADLFVHEGDMRVEGDVRIEGNLTIDGETFGNGAGEWIIKDDIVQESGKSIHAGNGATGSFDVVTVVDGIVVGGS